MRFPGAGVQKNPEAVIVVPAIIIPYNPAKVGFALVTIFLNLPNHYGLYV